MTYVWIEETSGKRRYVNDDFLNPCYKCGEKISVCQANGCNGIEEETNVMCVFCSDLGCDVCGQDKGCSFCGVDKASQCHCDNDYEDVAGK